MRRKIMCARCVTRAKLHGGSPQSSFVFLLFLYCSFFVLIGVLSVSRNARLDPARSVLIRFDGKKLVCQNVTLQTERHV